MKVSNWFTITALIVLVGSGNAFAQQYGSRANSAKYNYGGYYQEELLEEEDTAGAENDTVDDYANGCDDGGCGDEEENGCGEDDEACECPCYCFGPAEACTLFPSESAVKIGGWTQIGYHTEGANGIGTGLFNSRPNEVQLHQQWFYIEKAIDPSPCAWDCGYRFDYVYGTDGPDTQAFGGRPDDWDNDWDHGSDYGHAIPQLYFEAGRGDLKVKMGHFFTPIGYEVVAAPDNFFYSHEYTHYLSEPFTHTGVLADYAMNDSVTVYGGWTQGWDTGFTRNHGSTFLGGVSLQLTENASLAYFTVIGDFGFGEGASDSNGYMHSVVLDVALSDSLQWVFHWDFLDNQRFVGGTGQNWAIVNYLFYTVTDCWKFGVRGEWFSFAGDDVGELTLGANYKPHANITLRPEVRWDFFADGVNIFDEDGDPLRDSTTFGIDMIFTF